MRGGGGGGGGGGAAVEVWRVCVGRDKCLTRIRNLNFFQGPVFYLTFKCDIDLQTTQTKVSSTTTTPQGEYLCKIILKSMP